LPSPNSTAKQGMALTMVGIVGLDEFAWDEALNMSRSLGIGLHGAAGGYDVLK
jgi:hypothetical protein